MGQRNITIRYPLGRTVLNLPQFLDVATTAECAKYFKLLLANYGNDEAIATLDEYIPAWASEADTPAVAKHALSVNKKWQELRKKYDRW